MCAGTPTTVEFGGTSVRTTEPAPTREFSPDGDVAQDVGVVADEDAVADRGMALAVALAGAAQRHALVHGHVAAHDGGFADHHAGRVVDEQPPPEQRAGMNVDAGVEAGHLRENARGRRSL
jgi:hypothetical protein